VTVSKRDLILSTAKTLFIESGFRATTIAKIAEHANIAKGSIYSYFSSKNDIVKALLLQTDETRQNIIDALLNSTHQENDNLIKRYIELELGEVVKERDFLKAILNSDEMTLNEELIDMLQQLRVNYHMTQQKVILQSFGQPIESHLLDVTTILNALLQEYTIFLALDEAKFSLDHCAKFIQLNIKSIANNLIDHSVTPFLTKENFPMPLPSHSKFMQQQAIRDLLEEIKQFAQSQDNAIEEEIYNTLSLLEQELEQSSANKTLQRSLIANLRQFSALNKQLDALAPLLDLQLG